MTGSRARWYSLPMSASRRVVRTFAASAVLALGVAVVTAHPAAAATGTVLPAHRDHVLIVIGGRNFAAGHQELALLVSDVGDHS